MGHHPITPLGVDRCHALVIVTCSQHGSHALHLDSDDDMAWLIARNLQRYFTDHQLTAKVCEWETVDQADDAIISGDDALAMALDGWPQ